MAGLPKENAPFDENDENTGRTYDPNADEGNRVSGSFVTDPELRKLLSQPAPKAWVPNRGDAVAGTVTDITTSDAGKYGAYPIIEINTGSVSVLVHAYHETLQKDIERRNPQPGDMLAIVFNGEVESKVVGHNPYYSYRVIHRPAAKA